MITKLLEEKVGGNWSTSGDMIIRADPEVGGIIDRNPTLDKWFVIFNDDRDLGDEWFDTVEDAFVAFILEPRNG